MGTVQRIAKNTTVLIIADVIYTVIGFFFIMYVARYLGSAGFGILSFALAFAAIFNVFTDIGLSALTIREVARDRALARKYLGNIAVIKIILGVIVFGLIALVVNLLGYPEQTLQVVYLIGFSVILSSFSLMFHSIFQAYERMEFVTIGQVINNALLLSGAFLAISRGYDVAAIALVHLSANAIALIYNIVISIWKFAVPAIEIDLTFWKGTLKQAWPFGLVLVFVSIYYWIDSVMLSVMKGDQAVGWYNAAYRLVYALLFISGAYFKAIYPVMSRQFVSTNEMMRFTLEKSVKYMLLLALPIGVGTTLVARQAILRIFGGEYVNSILVLQILIWSLVFIFVSGVFAQLFNSINRQIIVTKVTGSCALLNIILNFILIPRYSYVGASIATVITEFIALVLVFFWSWKMGYGLSLKKFSVIKLKVFIACAVMGVFIYYCQNLALWWLVPLAALLYAILLFIIRVIDREDISLLKQVIQRK